jgi:hypothetical protein
MEYVSHYAWRHTNGKGDIPFESINICEYLILDNSLISAGFAF